MNWKALFPQFEPSLLWILEKEAKLKECKAGELIMRTGQFIKSTALVLEGQIKIYREGPEGGEFLMYYIGPGQPCAVSMICAVQAVASEITARAEEDTQLLMLPAHRNMDERLSFHISKSLKT